MSRLDQIRQRLAALGSDKRTVRLPDGPWLEIAKHAPADLAYLLRIADAAARVAACVPSQSEAMAALKAALKGEAHDD